MEPRQQRGYVYRRPVHSHISCPIHLRATQSQSHGGYVGLKRTQSSETGKKSQRKRTPGLEQPSSLLVYRTGGFRKCRTNQKEGQDRVCMYEEERESQSGSLLKNSTHVLARANL